MAPMGPSGGISAEEPAFLRLELLLREDAPRAQVGEALQLRRLRVRRPAGASAHLPLLVELSLVVDRLLDLFGLADVVEHLSARFGRGLHYERPGPDDPVDDPLLEPDVVDRFERHLHRILRDEAPP